MSVYFLTDEQYRSYAKYPTILTQDQLDKYFYLDDKDKELIDACRRDYNKLGYALKLTTVRFLGTFLSNPIDVPNEVVCYLAKQLAVELPVDIAVTWNEKQPNWHIVVKSRRYLITKISVAYGDIA